MLTVGAYLKKLRTNKGYTLKEMANILKVDISLISKIEKEERSLSKDLIPELADLFEIDFKSLQTTLISLMVAEQYGQEEYAVESLKMAVKQLQESK